MGPASRPGRDNLAELRSPVAGLFITGTDTGVGKTVIAASIADRLRRGGSRVAVLKPVATGCVHRREGLVSEDAELLAAAADTPHPLDLICPNRYLEPLAPSLASERSSVPVEWDAVVRSLRLMTANADILIVEGAGGICVPIDDRFTMLDLAAALGLPAVIVARATLGTVNHTLLTLRALREAQVPVAGVVVNNYPVDSPGVAEEHAPRLIERWGKVPLLCIVPGRPIHPPSLPPEILAAVGQVDWLGLAESGRARS